MADITKVQYFVVIFSLVVFVAAVLLGYIGQMNTEVFTNTTGGITEKYYQLSTPASVSFGVAWATIYVWNLVASVYLTVTLFLPSYKSPLKQEPPLLSNLYFIFHGVAFASTFAWILVFDRELLELSLAVIILCMISVYAIIVMACKPLADSIENGRIDETAECKVMIWCVRIIVQNGLGVFAAWITIATCLNLGIVITYKSSAGMTKAVMRGISVEDGSTIPVVIVLVAIVAWMVIDNFVWNKYTNYLFSPYPILILALGGLVGKRQSQGGSTRILIIASVALGIAVLATLIKIGVFLFRHLKNNKVGKNILEEDENGTSGKVTSDL
uniref:Uncharacterized LOC100178191 n=1 Tax=Ciona intestinalis TaxID=7719 RepID=F6UJP3_CIOIN|nr:uncharacterized protein LOC100178191 [Ciona intestinalis]|eukprot:XP_002124153.3 uncharacterized protein LOC100178191 [Ciona intestinalis]